MSLGIIDVTDWPYNAHGDWDGSLTTSHDDAAAIQAALDAAPEGGVVVLAAGHQYLCGSTLSITKAVSLVSFPLSGFQNVGAQLVFHGCDGVSVDAGYVRIANIGITATVQSTTNTVVPASNVFGKRGIIIGENAHAPHCTLTNVQVTYLDTGIHIPPFDGDPTAYHAFNNVDLIELQVGLASTGAATFASWSQGSVRDNSINGLYCKDSDWSFSEVLFEGNGYEGGVLTDDNLTNSHGAKKYGEWFTGSGGVYIFNGCWFNDLFVVDAGLVSFGGIQVQIKGGYVNEGLARFFGGGWIAMDNQISSPCIVPGADIVDWWTPSGTGGAPTLTDQTTYTQIQQAAGTSAGITYVDTTLAESIKVQDIVGYLFSVDIQVDNGHQDADFTVRGSVTLTQQSGNNAGPSDNQAWPLKDYYDWTIGTMKTLNFYFYPGFGTGQLDRAELNLKSITVQVYFGSSNFATHNLDARIQNPTLKLFTTREIDPRRIFRQSPKINAPVIQGLIDASAVNAGQIRFPATQNASSDVHTLDDYVEGIPSASWTPVDASGASLSLTVTSAQHLKVGKLAVATFSVTYPSTANTSAALVGGLLFTSATGTATLGGFVTYTDSGLTFSYLVAANSTTFDLRDNGGANITNVQLSGKTIRGVLVYFASA